MNQDEADEMAMDMLVTLVSIYPGTTAVQKIHNCIEDLRKRFNSMTIVTTSDRLVSNMLFRDIETLERAWLKARAAPS